MPVRELNELTRRRPGPSNAPEQRRPGLDKLLIAAVVSLLANARLTRASRRYRSRGSPELPDYLRQDVGMPPLDEMFRFPDRFGGVLPQHMPYKRRK